MFQLNRVKELLSFQLSSSRFKKNDLYSAYYMLSHVDINCKKSQLAQIISSMITEDLQVSYKILKSKDLNDENVWKQICKRLQNKLQILNLRGQSLSKKIQDIFNPLKFTNINNMTSNRQIRVSQQLIDNIWTTQTKQIQCLCPKAPVNLEQTKKTQICYRCNHSYHSQCFWSPQKGELFECPFCYLKFSNPQKQVKQILFGGYLPILKKQKIQYKLNFALEPKIKADKSLAIEARCVKFNSKNRYEISWPDNASFSFGKIRLNQFKPLQTNSPLKRRADQPIKLDKNRLQDNEIIIQERSTSQNGYKLNKKCYHLVTIMAYSELANQSVLHKFEKNEVSIKDSKKFLTDQMTQQVNDISISKISISLRCQYYSSRIKIPARSRLCTTHFQPFDLMSFITSSIYAKSSNRKWKCPICDKRAYDLVVDRYILNLMNQNPNANQIIFKQNGQPEMIQNKQDQNSDNQNQFAGQKFANDWDRKNNANAVIEIDLDQQNSQQQSQLIIQQILQYNNILANKTNNKPVAKDNQKQKEIQKQKQKQKQSFLIESQQQNERYKPYEPTSLIATVQKKSKLNNQQKQKQKQRRISNNRSYEIQQNKLKKIRKLNDGSLQVTQNINNLNKQNKDDKFFEIYDTINLVELSSDEQDDRQDIEIVQQIFNKNGANQQKFDKPAKKFTNTSYQNSQRYKQKTANQSKPNMKKTASTQQQNQNMKLNPSQKINSNSKSGISSSNKTKNKNNEEKNRQLQQTVILIDSQNEEKQQQMIPERVRTQQQMDLGAWQLLQQFKRSNANHKKIEISTHDNYIFETIEDRWTQAFKKVEIDD